MNVKITADTNGQKIYKIVWPDTQLDFLLVDRDSAISYDKEAVYILMDKFRRCFYIGETGGTKGGGVANRIKRHKWEKEFWDSALVIRDRNGDFDSGTVRAWFEWKLNAIAKSANTAVILSGAGEQVEPAGVKKRLDDILAVCRFIGISWAFYEEENGKKESAEKKTTTMKKPKAANKPTTTKSSVKPPAKETPQKELNQTQVAKYIANRVGKPGAYGHIWLILAGKGNKNGRKCGKGGELRKVMEELGIKFDDDDYVIDWKVAKIPV